MSQTCSDLATNIIGSEVLKISGEINELKKLGKKVINFTVGDFDPKYFPIPAAFKSEILKAVELGDTNYPPSNGIPELRQAVCDFYNRAFETQISTDEILISGGARPLIYGFYKVLVDPGDSVLYPVPSWNNNHYCYLTQAKGIPLVCKPENGFMPVLSEIKPLISKLRMICLNSPLNPTGTTIKESELRKLLEDIVTENEKRKSQGSRPLYLMYDQIYWMLNFDKSYRHPLPTQLVPESKPYVVYVDGISKYFCATGLRVGWSVAPKEITQSLSSFLGHVGAWAPKPEQKAMAVFLQNSEAVSQYVGNLKSELQKRLDTLFDGIQKLKSEGVKIDAIKPQGAIYLSLQIQNKDSNLETNESKRKRLLEKTGIAVVPFQAFGLKEENGWFRMSVGAVSMADIKEALEMLRKF